MQANDTDDFQQRVLNEFKKVNQRLDKLDTDVGSLKQELVLTNTRVDTYQKASNQVVNFAFGLIATANLTIIASVVLR